MYTSSVGEFGVGLIVGRHTAPGWIIAHFVAPFPGAED
jgi:hypothetical protein